MKTNTSILKITLLLITLQFLIISCERSHEYDNANNIPIESTGENEKFKAVAINSEMSENQNTPDDIKIIRNATMRMRVRNVNEATRLARNYALQYSGYVSDERMENNSYLKENRFTIRVPQEYFDTIIDSISSFSENIDTKNVSTIDVTEEYVDIESRLQTKREVKERYEAILRSKAKTVKEVLLAEEKIRILQEEIEVAEGRLRYMSTNITYSTIQIDLYEVLPEVDAPEDKGPSFFDKVKDSLSFGLSLIEGLLLLLLHIWPVTLAGIILGLWLLKKRKARN
ncbi:DUF4349 domain-containing protein [Dokdonia sp.]|uniref:DUF4349 domain-containing protein n=1 Tax=Dokdonia sp. TaxID=2024995 RepID=UPI0032679404